MAVTGHGHHIPGTTMGEFKPKNVTRCGGPKMCPRCKAEVESSMAFIAAEPDKDNDAQVQLEK